MPKKMTMEEVRQILKEIDLTICDNEPYVNDRTKIKCKDKEGYILMVVIHDVRQGKIPSKFGKNNPYTLENIKNYIRINKINVILKEYQTYKNSMTKLIFICPTHGEFEKNWSDFKQGYHCQYCSIGTKEIHDGNRLSTNRPDLIKYFINPKDADNYTVNSHTELVFRCPNCKKEKKMMIKTLSSYGFGCRFCSDGVSIPEKFCIALLEQLKIDFVTQKKFDWSEGKFYDCYFILNNKKWIIETHGKQHYEESFGHIKKSKTLTQEQENDKLKYNLAINNGINNYIIIDCRYSDFNYLREQFEKELNTYFDLKNIDWEKIKKNCLTSLIMKAIELYNNKISIVEIAKQLNLSQVTIRDYLRKGFECNLCNYSPHLKPKKEKKPKIERIIHQYNENNEIIQSFFSIMEAQRVTGVCNANISECISNKRKTAGGFKWKDSYKTISPLLIKNNKNFKKLLTTFKIYCIVILW